jgi:hypothetical protein
MRRISVCVVSGVIALVLLVPALLAFAGWKRGAGGPTIHPRAPFTTAEMQGLATDILGKAMRDGS